MCVLVISLCDSLLPNSSAPSSLQFPKGTSKRLQDFCIVERRQNVPVRFRRVKKEGEAEGAKTAYFGR